MKRYIFALSILSIGIAAMDVPDSDDAPLMPLELTETVEYDDGDMAHAFYNPRTQSIRLVKFSNLFPAKRDDCHFSLLQTFKEQEARHPETFSDIRTLGLTKLPKQELFYAALAKTSCGGQAILGARFAAKPVSDSKWASGLFSTRGKIVTFQFFINHHTAKIVWEIETEYQNNYEKSRVYVPLNFSDPILGKLIESRQLGNETNKKRPNGN